MREVMNLSSRLKEGLRRREWNRKVSRLFDWDELKKKGGDWVEWPHVDEKFIRRKGELWRIFPWWVMDESNDNKKRGRGQEEPPSRSRRIDQEKKKKVFKKKCIFSQPRRMWK